MDFLWLAAAFADHVASGALTSEFVAERQRLEGMIECLWAAYGGCSGQVGCGKQEPQADGEIGGCGGREGGSQALVEGGEEGREQSLC
jgi:hypothetical protein